MCPKKKILLAIARTQHLECIFSDSTYSTASKIKIQEGSCTKLQEKLAQS